MKRLEISRLMDEYQDNEFFPEGGSVADPEAVKGWVLANVRAPAKKARKPAKKKLLLAAALAAVLVVLVGAGYLERTYQIASGTLAFREDADGRTIDFSGMMSSTPLEWEDGRLIFVLDGERTDVTDLIDENTPYIHDASDPDAGIVSYLILGGTPEHYGWFRWNIVPDPYTDNPNYEPIANEDGLVYVYDLALTTEEYYCAHLMGFDNPDWRMFSDFNPEFELNPADFQWLQVAADQLNIPFIDSTGETVTTIYE